MPPKAYCIFLILIHLFHETRNNVTFHHCSHDALRLHRKSTGCCGDKLHSLQGADGNI